jgi:hypothetical protein
MKTKDIQTYLVSSFIISQAILCFAITKDDFFPYGIEDQKLPSDRDDVSAPEFQLSVPIVFYETSYKTIFVSFRLL